MVQVVLVHWARLDLTVAGGRGAVGCGGPVLLAMEMGAGLPADGGSGMRNSEWTTYAVRQSWHYFLFVESVTVQVYRTDPAAPTCHWKQPYLTSHASQMDLRSPTPLGPQGPRMRPTSPTPLRTIPRISREPVGLSSSPLLGRSQGPGVRAAAAL